MPQPGNQLSSTATNLAAWQTYASQRLTAEGDRPGLPTRLNWSQIPGLGPGVEILGDITGRHILELGCGPGDTSAYLAPAGAHVLGIDGAPAQIQRARHRWHHPRLHFAHAEALDYLQQPGPSFDVIISVFGALDWTPPATLLPHIADRLAPAGLLAFSTIHPARHRQTSPHLSCPSGQIMPLVRQPTGPEDWPALLAHAGLRWTATYRIGVTLEHEPHCILVTAQRAP